MTLEDLIARESIRDTIARASHAGDHLVPDDYAACFTPDGVLEHGESLHKQGRDAIRAWVEMAKRHEAKRGLMRHNVTSIVIDMTGADSAAVKSYYHVYMDTGPDHFGWYRDRFARHDGQWLLSHREVGVDWVSPQSRFARRKADA